jgi:hypothetical protein
MPSVRARAALVAMDVVYAAGWSCAQVVETFGLRKGSLPGVRALVERLVYPRIHGLCFDQVRGQDVMSRRDAR